MDEKEALKTLIEQSEIKEALSLLESDKEVSKGLIEEYMANAFNTSGKNSMLDHDCFIRLFNLAIRFDVCSLSKIEPLINDDQIFKNENGDICILPEEFGNFLAHGISDIDDEKKLEGYYFSDKASIWLKEALYYAIKIFLSVPIGLNGLDCILEPAVIKERHKILVGFYINIIGEINKSLSGRSCDSNDCNNLIYELLQADKMIFNIALDSYYKNYYESIELKKLIRDIVIKVITKPNFSNNSKLLQDFFNCLKLIAPEIFCKAKEVESFIKNLWRTLYKLDIFETPSILEIGKKIFDVVKNNTGCKEDNTVKIGIQMVHQYPINTRNNPCTDEEYYNEITEYLEIKKLPWNVYSTAKKEYANVRNQYETLISRIDIIEEKCERLIRDSEEVSQDIIAKQRKKILTEDSREDKNTLLTELQRCKVLETLYKPGNQTEMASAERANGDSYLEYCKETLAKVFDFFTNISEVEKHEETLKIWVLSDVQNTKTGERSIDRGYEISEKFTQYYRIIKQFNELLDDDPWKTIHIIMYRVKALTFMNEIRDRHWKKSGLKIFDESSEEYKILNSEIDNHPLNFKEIMKVSDIMLYQDHLDMVIDEAITNINKNIHGSICIKKRKPILNKILQIFENEKDYDLVVNMIPIQVEGLFADYLDDSLLYESELHMEKFQQIYKYVLNKKASLIDLNGLNLGFDAIGYFKYYFNSVLRNTVAHGNYKLLLIGDNRFQNLSEAQALKILAYEMILDLNFIIDVVAKSNEIDEALRYVQYTSESIQTEKSSLIDDPDVDTEDTQLLFMKYERLFLDLIGESRFNFGKYHDGILITFEPLQVLYWIFNPQFEEVLKKEIVVPIRETLLSEKFWKYVYDNIEKWNPVFNRGRFRGVLKKLIPLLYKNGTAFDYVKRLHNMMED